MYMTVEINMHLNRKLSHKDTTAIAKKLGDFGTMDDYVNFEGDSLIFKMTKEKNRKYITKLLSFLEQFLEDTDVNKIGMISIEAEENNNLLIYAFKQHIFITIEGIKEGKRSYKIFDVKGNEYKYNMEGTEQVPIENHVAATYFLHYCK
ncbi:hypothetical protein P4236_31130 [Bacillus thuringiensis]|nr:hypothetical protein [Bacillus thuringiensis]